jgi:N-methylhydantoinase B
MIGGYDAEGNAYIDGETNWGGWGGRPFSDGVEFCTPPFSNASNQPCETNEERYSNIMYNQYAYVADTEGAGKFRGSLSVARDWKFLGDDAILQLRTDRQTIPPYGLYGGKPGALSESIINPDTENRRIGKITMNLKKGDVYRLFTQGGGGWGDPLERDPKLVQDDVRNEKVSLKRAREVYGVVIKKDTLEVDYAKTDKLRNTIKKKPQ